MPNKNTQIGHRDLGNPIGIVEVAVVGSAKQGISSEREKLGLVIALVTDKKNHSSSNYNGRTCTNKML